MTDDIKKQEDLVENKNNKMLLHATSIIFDACSSQTSNFAQLEIIFRTKVQQQTNDLKDLEIIKKRMFS